MGNRLFEPMGGTVGRQQSAFWDLFMMSHRNVMVSQAVCCRLVILHNSVVSTCSQQELNAWVSEIKSIQIVNRKTISKSHVLLGLSHFCSVPLF